MKRFLIALLLASLSLNLLQYRERRWLADLVLAEQEDHLQTIRKWNASLDAIAADIQARKEARKP